MLSNCSYQIVFHVARPSEINGRLNYASSCEFENRRTVNRCRVRPLEWTVVEFSCHSIPSSHPAPIDIAVAFCVEPNYCPTSARMLPLATYSAETNHYVCRRHTRSKHLPTDRAPHPVTHFSPYGQYYVSIPCILILFKSSFSNFLLLACAVCDGCHSSRTGSPSRHSFNTCTPTRPVPRATLLVCVALTMSYLLAVLFPVHTAGK